MAWKKGPMPPDTWGWGGVVPTGDSAGGFFFADFCGDCVQLIPSYTTLKPDEVAWYDNAIQDTPPTGPRAMGEPPQS